MYPLNAVISHFCKFHLRLGLPGSIFSSRLPIKNLCVFLTATVHCACPLAVVFGNANAKVALVHFVKTYWSRRTAPPILNLGTGWSWVMSFTSRLLYPRERNPPPPVHVEYKAGLAPNSVWKFWNESRLLQPIAWTLRQLSYTGCSSVTQSS